MKAWKPLLFTIPVEGLSVGMGTLPGIHIFARLLNPNYILIHWSSYHRGTIPPKDTVIMFGWAATGLQVCVRTTACCFLYFLYNVLYLIYFVAILLVLFRKAPLQCS